MTREEMLNKLHSIRLGAQPTVITNDMGLQYEYVTKEGHGEGFGDMGDWPAYRLMNISAETLTYIQKQIRERTLKEEDLTGTDLYLFYRYVFDIPRPESCIPEICDFFEDLLSISLGDNGLIFVLCDARQWEPEAYFYSTYDELEEAFADYYVSYIEEWENLDDDELEEWVHRIEGLGTIPFIILRHQEEEEPQ